ncbi:E1 ubiquitin-activating protein aos1 [Sporothrix curviconia]|uniref:E1 ubiquitin-activating protein aos1 n=1 Tax=Sporothrix curviconia TaxID=1260050 RepID=A0ABP0B137_9PEZI
MANTNGITNGSTGAYALLPSAAQNPASALPEVRPGMTEDEIALYDRQIRLWGMRAQEKLRSANVLLVTMRALGNEVAKNLVLAGIGSLTIADHENVTEENLGAQFLLATPSAGDVVPTDATSEQRQAADRAAAAAVIGTNRAVAVSQQLGAMNPRVKIVVEQRDVSSLAASYFEQFSLVIVTDRSPAVLNYINTATRLQDRPFYAASTYGFYGFIFADLIEHDFMITRDRGNIVSTRGDQETRTRTIIDVKVEGEEGAAAAGIKETVTKREVYSTWYLASDASPLPANIRSVPRRLRNVTPLLPCLRALWAFQEKHDGGEDFRMPNINNAEDRAQFIGLVNEKQAFLGTPPVAADKIREFLQSAESMHEISPVATVLGGQLAQDVINTIGHTQQPIQNLLVFDGTTMQSAVYAMHPSMDLGSAQLATAPNTTASQSSVAEATGRAAKAINATADRILAAGIASATAATAASTSASAAAPAVGWAIGVQGREARVVEVGAPDCRLVLNTAGSFKQARFWYEVDLYRDGPHGAYFSAGDIHT